MRALNPYPWGHAPRNQDVVVALAAAVRGVLLRRDGTAVGLAAAELAPLGELARIREGEPAFDLVYEPIWFLHLDGEAGRVATLRLSRDGAVHFQSAAPDNLWSGFADVVAPRALLVWLAAQGEDEPLVRWDQVDGEAGARAAEAWTKAVPPAIAAAWSALPARRPVPADFAPAAVAQLEAALGSAGAIAALLAWYGAGSGPLSRRPDGEEIVRGLLARYDFDLVVGAMASLDDARGRAGAGRFLLDSAPFPPILWRTVERLPEADREALVAALAQTASSTDGEALRALLFPTPVGAPAGTTLVGASITVQLRRPLSDGQTVIALDGTDVARFAEGRRTALFMMLGTPPLALADGVLLVAAGGAVARRNPLDGSLIDRLAGPTPAERERARNEIATWTAASTVPAELVAITPSADELAAHEAFSHTGAAPPPAARVAGRAFLDVAGAALVLHDEAGHSTRVALPGRPLRTAVTADAIHVLVEIAGGCVIASIADAALSSPPRLSDPIAVAAAGVAFFFVANGAAVLGIDGGAGILIARKPLAAV